MTVTATVLFESPRSELASLLRDRLMTSVRTQIVAGFVTRDGMAAIADPIHIRPESLDTFVVGAGTYGAFVAFDKLLDSGVRSDALKVHLGHSRSPAPKGKHRYRPMLHSKVYYMERDNGTASAVVGSHNATAFALLGLNGEASVLLEGETSSPEFEKVRKHIAKAKHEAITYSTEMKLALANWTHQYMEGLTATTNDVPRDGERSKTILLLCEHSGTLPAVGQLLYFELHEDLGNIRSLSADIHLYIFDALPNTPDRALLTLESARSSYRCQVVGLDTDQGGYEFRADWYLEDVRRPILKRSSATHRPVPKREMQQVRVRIDKTIPRRFEYLFDVPDEGWLPEIDSDSEITLPGSHGTNREKLKPVSKQTDSWFLVKNLAPFRQIKSNKLSLALERMSPKEGAFVLMSLRRRDLGSTRG